MRKQKKGEFMLKVFTALFVTLMISISSFAGFSDVRLEENLSLSFDFSNSKVVESVNFDSDLNPIGSFTIEIIPFTSFQLNHVKQTSHQMKKFKLIAAYSYVRDLSKRKSEYRQYLS